LTLKGKSPNHRVRHRAGKGEKMSLNQKFTWNDFLKANPEHKEKGTKRTSSEGKKAFEKAYKDYIKKYLGDRAKTVDADIATKTKKRDELVAKLVEVNKSKNKIRIKFQQNKVGKVDAAIVRSQKMGARNKVMQKNFK
jgi:hypothetical protein